ncbi:membrane protein DedA with SNARE-associated domain [Rhizobium giardinii]|uniref:Membrane protein DedA with SNARE-associated domain n=1 Tax=Rhizobium giardinii TaxID=56731 RepID=A0A7W8UAA4_9HYPH|nr:membrane protein DedA with SNARE-associated domain [Rhizobium giardinii]
MCVLYPSQAVDRLLETIDLSSVYLASLMGRSLPVLPSYVLLPAIGMRETGVADLVLRCVFSTASVFVGTLGPYLVGTWIGIGCWFSQADNRYASAPEATGTARGQQTFEADQ